MDSAKVLRYGTKKPGLQYKETRVLSYTTYSQKYELDEDDTRKNWKQLRLSGGEMKQ